MSTFERRLADLERGRTEPPTPEALPQHSSSASCNDAKPAPIPELDNPIHNGGFLEDDGAAAEEAAEPRCGSSTNQA